jgi:hypothetical protein
LERKHSRYSILTARQGIAVGTLLSEHGGC